ncbi:MAG: DUF5060 domain-containing protein [Planctomycetota bacterium]|nr:DUF5060 domain-containing protein [Planctomycetota bacterium]
MVAVIFVLWAAALVYRDYLRTMRQQTGRAAIFVLAEEALKQVQDPANGWFPAPNDPIFGWEQNEQGWQLEGDAPAIPTVTKTGTPSPANAAAGSAGKRPLSIVDTGDSAHGNALAIPVSFPDPATVYRDTNAIPGGDPNRLQGIRFIAYDVFVPRKCPGYVGCLLFLKNKDGLWYQARTRASLVPGAWTTVTADIRGDSQDVTPLGHLGQWDDNQATQVRTVGITFYGNRSYDGEVWLDNLRGWMRPQRFKQMVAQLNGPRALPVAPERAEMLQKLAARVDEYKEPPVRILNLRAMTTVKGQTRMAEDAEASPPVVPRFETLTLRFELSRQVDNPFDPERADVTCLVVAPSGKAVEHIGFWYQDYDRAARFVDDDLTPIARAEWRVRITPREEGEHRFTLCVKLKGEDPVKVPTRTFVCVPSDGRGFIRVSQKDPRFLEFESGSFFYPIGHNISTPVDIRCWREIFKKDPPAGRGLAMYAELFDKMQANRENTVEIWMASWWLGIEWTARWRDYHGAARYSLQHAWKLDALLEMARAHGIYIHLVIDNHGKFSQWCDWEWDDNPYNSRSPFDNGIVSTAEDFFTDPTARKLHRNKLRYIAARWGPDPAVMGWELVSEYDLVGGTSQVVDNKRHPRVIFHRSPVLQAWAREMIGLIRQCDPYGHPITNHYATDYTLVDVKLVAEQTPDGKPLVDYVATDAYRPDRPYTLAATRMQNWATTNLRGPALKPFWITEYGADFNVGCPPSGLDADIHCGLWSTWMTEGMGTPLFWWYDFVDVNNLYPYYRAFANYVDGEDRRGLNGSSGLLHITDGNDAGELQGTVYRWNKGAYAWAYNTAAMQLMPPAGSRPKHSGVVAAMPGLDAGKYRLEFWDCYEGKMVGSDTQELPAGQTLQVKFPPFANNMAVKVKSQ